MTQSQREPQAMLTGIFVRAEINGEWKAVDLASPELPIDAALAWLKEQDGSARRRLAHALMQVMQEQEPDSDDVAESIARLLIFFVRNRVMIDWGEAMTLTETAMAQGVAAFVRERGLALAGHTGEPFGPGLQVCTLLARNALYALPISVRELMYRQMYLLAHTQAFVDPGMA